MLQTEAEQAGVLAHGPQQRHLLVGLGDPEDHDDCCGPQQRQQAPVAVQQRGGDDDAPLRAHRHEVVGPLDEPGGGIARTRHVERCEQQPQLLAGALPAVGMGGHRVQRQRLSGGDERRHAAQRRGEVGPHRRAEALRQSGRVEVGVDEQDVPARPDSSAGTTPRRSTPHRSARHGWTRRLAQGQLRRSLGSVSRRIGMASPVSTATNRLHVIHQLTARK